MSRRLRSTVSFNAMPEHPFRFHDLPQSVRQRVYHFLGFPVQDTCLIFTDKTHKTEIILREIYKVDLTSGNKLSVPWNYGNERRKHLTPRVETNLLLANQNTRDELYPLLYTKSLFIVHLQNKQKPNMTVLSDKARSYISHIILSYTASPTTLSLFGTASHPLALVSALNAVTPLVPNIRYIGINFWTPHFSALFPPPANNVTATSDNKGPTDACDNPNFTDMLFLTRCLNELVSSHPSIEVFALLRDMRAMGRLNWNREKSNVRKAMARDIRKCMAKLGNSAGA